MNVDDANVLRDMLIRIQTNTALMNALTKFNMSVLALNACWNSSAYITIGDSNATSSNDNNDDVEAKRFAERKAIVQYVMDHGFISVENGNRILQNLH